MSKLPLRVFSPFFLVLVLPLVSCDTKTCTLVGCVNGATLQRDDVGIEEADLTNVEILACWNGVCSKAAPTLVASGGVNCTFTGSIQVVCQLWVEDDGKVAMNLFVEPSAPVQNGDVYQVRIVHTDGTEMFEVEQAVTYTEHYPNGEECDEEPCLGAQL